MALDRLSVTGTLPLSLFLKNSTGASFRKRAGVLNIPALDVNVSLGSGAGKCQWLYWSEARVLAATTFDTFDLYGSLVDVFGATVSAATLKLAAVMIHGADGTRTLRVGPQNQSAAMQGPWGGIGATVYEAVYDWWKAANL